jgi:DEAD/DEAH box helicase domain-containing protein
MSENEIRAYHLIITDLEAPRIAEERSIKEGSWYPIKDVEYFITYEELRDFLRRRNFKNPDVIITSLINKGFLVQLPRSDSKSDYPLLRSLHMDVLVRSSQITTMYGNPPYLLSYKFAITKFKVPVKEDRTIIPGGNDSLWKELYNTIQFFFNNNHKLVDIYVDALKEYLSQRGTGLDSFQSHVLRKMLSSDKNVYAIVAPTGSGKTEIYLFYSLAVIMRWRLLEGDNSKKVLLVYPRKALTVDQAYRIIELLSIVNDILKDKYKYEIKITFGIRDGDTPRNVNRREAFRGVTCPYCRGELIYDSEDVIACKKCGKEFNFIKTVRRTTVNADLIATNPWALETRLLDSAIEDVGARTLRDAALVVFDEAHEYTGVSGGILASLIDVLREINKQKDVKLVFSSATIPNPGDFIEKLSGDNNYEILDFGNVQRRLQIKGERLVILAHFMMNPQYSWNTYCQLWSVFMAFLSYAYKLRKVQQPQSILFINNIRELRRVKSGYIESLRVGEPKDHLADNLDPLDPYCYWHYLPTNLVGQIRNQASGGLVDVLKEFLLEIHSEVPRETREKAVARLRSGEGAVVLSTSSLELGVDYDGVGFVLNAGLDNPISFVQRIGRGGRGDRTARCVLGIILARALPTEILKTYDENFMKAIATMSISGYKLFVTKDNPQIIKRRILIESIAKLAVEGKDTYESGASKGPIKNLETLQSFIQDIVGKISESHERI